MSFINKDVNKGLLILILAVLFVMAGLEVFYALNFKSINTKYDTKIKELNNTYNALASYQGALNKTKSELQLKAEREADLSTQYVGVKGERDTLEGLKNKLQSDNTVLKATLSQKEDDLTQLNVKYVAVNRTVFAQRTQIEGLNSQVGTLQSQLSACQAKLPA